MQSLPGFPQNGEVLTFCQPCKLRFFKVGTHQRIRLQDLMDYKRRRAEESEAAMQALAEQAQDHDMGY